MILLDTNVVSETLRPAPSEAVAQWLRSQSASTLFMSAVTEAELRVGVELLPHGKRKLQLQGALDAILTDEFAGRVLPFDSGAALSYAQVFTARRRLGRPLSELDAQIAAIARSRNAALATRNTTDFDECGIRLINPWG